METTQNRGRGRPKGTYTTISPVTGEKCSVFVARKEAAELKRKLCPPMVPRTLEFRQQHIDLSAYHHEKLAIAALRLGISAQDVLRVALQEYLIKNGIIGVTK